jgi:uncharacterized protein YegP (UPF0339 family)
MRFLIFRSVNNQFYFNIEASNGEKLCTSETYVQKESAYHAISVIRAECPTSIVLDCSPFQK